MDLKAFIKHHQEQVDFSKFCIKNEDVESIEKVLDVKIGDQLLEYILTYGYLGYEYIDFLGINSRLMEKSNMVKSTQYLHQYFEKTNNLISFEAAGDGVFFLVDSDDNVYEYASSDDELIKTKWKLFDYILDRFENCVVK